MNKNKRIIIVILALVVMFSIKISYAEGGRNGECLDADITGYKDDGDQTSYRSEVGTIIEGVCIKAGNDSFGDGHSQEITSNGTYDGCYVIEGLGTQNITISRKNDSSCKEISHIDMYLGSQVKEEDPVITQSEPEPTPEPKEAEPEPEPIQERSIVIEPEETEPEIILAAVDTTETEEEILEEQTQGQDEDIDEDVDEDENDDEDEEYTEDISDIKELPKTGAYDYMSMIGLFLIFSGFTLKKVKPSVKYYK